MVERSSESHLAPLRVGVRLVTVLVLTVVMLSVGQVNAFTFSPNPSISEQLFTISASSPADHFIR